MEKHMKTRTKAVQMCTIPKWISMIFAGLVWALGLAITVKHCNNHINKFFEYCSIFMQYSIPQVGRLKGTLDGK